MLLFIIVFWVANSFARQYTAVRSLTATVLETGYILLDWLIDLNDNYEYNFQSLSLTIILPLSLSQG